VKHTELRLNSWADRGLAEAAPLALTLGAETVLIQPANLRTSFLRALTLNK
jgi:hypothetical protein